MELPGFIGAELSCQSKSVGDTTTAHQRLRGDRRRSRPVADRNDPGVQPLRFGFSEDNTVNLMRFISAGPIADSSFHLESGSDEFINKDSLRHAMSGSVFRDTFWNRCSLAWFFINHPQPSSSLQRPEQTRIDFSRFCKVVVYESHEYGVTASRWKVRVGVGCLDGSDVLLLLSQFFQMRQQFCTDFRAIDLP